MLKNIIIVALIVAGSISIIQAQTRHSFKCKLCGTWVLLERIDRNANGDVVSEPTLGQDPIGILIYDRAGNMSVQIMKRNRNSTAANESQISSNSNNIGAANGYVAYFGKYKIDFKQHTVTHLLEGSISDADVGKSVTRNFIFKGNELWLSFETINGSTAVKRTLRWRHVE